MIDLRPYQLEAISRVRRALAGGTKRVMLCAPTGSGKTVIASHIIVSALEHGSRTLFLAHRKELIRQPVTKLLRYGVSPEALGVIMAGVSLPPSRGLPGAVAAEASDAELWSAYAFSRPDAPVQIASIDTARRRLDRLPPANIVIVDEAHRSLAASYHHAGNAVEHGLPQDDREWTLEGRKRRPGSGAPPCWKCDECLTVNPLSEQVCLECGAERPVRVRRQIAERAGELVELRPLTEDEKACAWDLVVEEWRARWEAGKPTKPGWCYHRFRDRYRSAPPRGADKPELTAEQKEAVAKRDELRNVAAARGYSDAWVHARLASPSQDVNASTQGDSNGLLLGRETGESDAVEIPVGQCVSPGRKRANPGRVPEHVTQAEPLNGESSEPVTARRDGHLYRAAAPAQPSFAASGEADPESSASASRRGHSLPASAPSCPRGAASRPVTGAGDVLQDAPAGPGHGGDAPQQSPFHSSRGRR